MALDHFIDYLLRARLVGVAALGHGVNCFLHAVELMLHLVRILQLCEVSGAMEHVLRKSAAGVLAETGHALAVNAMLGPRQIRQGRQVQLAQCVIQFCALLVGEVLFIQGLIQIGHESATNGITSCGEILITGYLRNLITIIC